MARLLLPLLLAALGLSACPKPEPEQGQSPTVPGGAVDPGGPTVPGPTVPGGAVDPGPAPDPSMPATCLRDADCNGGVCEGQGCGDDQPGTCAPEGRVCTRDSRPYCGCDGQTFRSSGSCPGRRFAKEGECQSAGTDGGNGGGKPTAKADGSPCLASHECQSGICEGEGCGKDQPGECKPASRPCTRDLRPYCGCDGKTFRSSGTCPGQRFSARAECGGKGDGTPSKN